MRRSLLVVFAASALLGGTYVSSASAATVVNGDFETGDLTGWSLESDNGEWLAYSGTPMPDSPFAVQPPPQGTFAAITDGGAATRLLYQNVALEAGQQHVLSMLVYYDNHNGEFHSPGTLDWDAGVPNQQYRIDVMDPNAPLRSLVTGDVLLNVFNTQPGDPLSLAPTTVTADLSSLAGRTVRLRFAEADNQFYFHAGVDAVSITTPAPPAPTARCAGRDATIVGTDGNDVLVGTGGKDVIAGLKGKDTLRGRGGNDRLCGKDGKDLLKGGGGNDRIRGGDGKDTMKGGGGNDKCKGGPGRDTDESC